MVDSGRGPRYAWRIEPSLPKLRPFVAHVARGEGAPMIPIEGRIDGDVYTVSAFGSAVTLLPLKVAQDARGSFALMPPCERKFENGLVLAVRALAARNAPPRVSLAMHSESPAMPQARPLFGKLGGDPRLVRMIAPSAWLIELAFDTDGAYVEHGPVRPRARGSA